jgi:pyruvate/2-oxoglutarate dehydrogenase complex dihydrolipoamide acyltransferase (E2) component
VTGRQRIVLLAIAAVVLVAGIALASGGGDDDQDATATTPAAQTQEAPASEPAATQETAPAEPPAPRVETIRMRGRAPVGEPRTLRYERGDAIRLRFTSDVAEEVHIHGFDEYVDVPAGGTPKAARLKADLEGIFEVEAHSSGEILAKLEIRPK